MTQIVGILNLTPDSFSGDGLVTAPEAALARIDEMIADGAAVIDIGAESTRPGAKSVSPEEEWQRLAPVVTSLGKRLNKVRFSIDTHHVVTAQRAMTYGFDWLNDVSGSSDRAMPKVAKDSGCQYVIMHSLSVPADPGRTIDASADPVEVILAWAEEAVDHLEYLGIKRSRIILDPGIGFGKTAEQSLAIIHNIARLKALELPVMVGHSRKSFLALVEGDDADRDSKTLAISKYLLEQGVDYLRVHDVKSHAALLRCKAAS